MRTFYAIQTVYDDVQVTKVRAEDEDCALDAVDYNQGATIILRADEALKVMNSIKKLRSRNVN